MIIIAALFTALLGPYFVNWTSYKQTFETETSRLIGQKVTVGGRADLRLLPSPKITFTDVRIGDSETEPVVVVERFLAELELSPLLRGEIRVLNMAVERPVVTFDLAHLEGPNALSWHGATFDPDDVSLSNVEIQGGRALISDSRTGRQWQITTFNGQLDARSLSGPAQIEWGAMIGAKPISGRLAIGRSGSAESLPITVTVEPPDWPAVIIADGHLTRDEGGRPNFGGTLQLTGNESGLELEPDQAIDLFSTIAAQGDFLLTPENLDIPEFNASIGSADRPVQFVGEAAMALGVEPSFDIAISARQIDLDRSLGGGPDEPVSLEAAATTLLAKLGSLPVPDFRGEVRIDATGVVVGGNVIRALGTDLRPHENGWQVEVLSAVLPGATRLDVTGDLSVIDTPAFIGTVSLQSQRPSSFATWLRPAAPVPTSLDGFSIRADVLLSEAEIAASGLTAKFGEGQTTGRLQVRNFSERNERFAVINLSSDRLDLDQAQELASLLVGQGAGSESLDRLTFDLHAESAVSGDVEAKTVIATGVYEPSGLQLQNLSIADLAGAQIFARGNIGNPLTDPAGRLDGSILADDLTGTARFLNDLLPENRMVDAFQNVAPFLAPASADISVVVEEDGSVSTIDLTGQFADTNVTLTASGAGDLGDIENLSVDLNALLVSQDTSQILNQFGLDVIPLPNSGAARISVDLTGSFDEFASLALDGEAAGVGFQFDGRLSRAEQLPTLAGNLSIDTPSIDTALLLAGVAVPGVGEGHSLTASGALQFNGKEMSYDLESARWNDQLVTGGLNARLRDTPTISGELKVASLSVPLLTTIVSGQLPNLALGSWSNKTFAPAVPGGVRYDLNLASEIVDLGLPVEGQNARLRLTYNGEKLAIDDFYADFAGGRLTGSFAAEHRDGSVDFDTNFSVSDAVLQELIWRANDRAVATGTLDMSIAIAGEGRTMSGLVSSLTGSGTIAISEGRVRAINPRAFGSIIQAADRGMDLDTETVEAVFSGFLDQGTLSFGRATGSFAVSGGVVRISTMSIDTPSATVLGSATFDLNRLQLSSDWSLKVDPGDEAVAGAEPEVGLIFSGTIDQPNRKLDVSPLLGFLTVRSFEKEVARIEKLQAEILEEERLRRELRLFRERERRREQAAAAAEEAAQEEADEAERQAEIARQEATERQAEQERIQAEAAAEAERQAAEEAAARQAAQEREQAEAAAEAARLAEEEAAAREAAQRQAEAEAEAARRAEAEAEALAREAESSLEREIRALREQAAAEAAARREAEERAAAEAAARRAAEDRAANEAAARLEAERRAEAEAAARRAAEDRAAVAATGTEDTRNPLILLEPSLLPDGAQPSADGTFQLPGQGNTLPSGDELLGRQPVTTNRRATGAPLSILPPRIIQDYPIFEEPRLQPLR